MADRVSSRVEGAIHQILSSLNPPQLPDEDDESFQARCEFALQKGRRLIQEGRSPPEVNQSHDLIRRKLLREHASPEKAARFGNLYSRLLTSPVLNQKWSILYLLLSLSESDQLEDILDEWDKSDTPEPETEPANLEQEYLEQKKLESEKVLSTAKPQPETAVEETYTMEPTEAALLQDLPFNLQGLSSAHLKFSGATVQLPPTLPIPILSLLHILAEPCLLYRSLLEFTESADGGLIGQSLRAAVGLELRSYLSLIGTLEGEIRRGLADPPQAGVTLKRCVIWTRDATLALRLMKAITEKSSERRGGQLISLVHAYSSSHGDPFVAAFAERLLVLVTRPFYDMLRRWIYDGELVDPYHEFFVSEIAAKVVDSRRVETSVWEDKYSLEVAMMPSIIGGDFAKKIFLIGKSLNFLRNNCGDSDWVMNYSKVASKELCYGDTATLETSIDEAYKTTMARLTLLMSTKYHLFTHLAAIKQYLLLSQGDFIALLMESLAPHLDRPAYSQYRHTLTSQLEHAIRHSNAQYSDPEVLSRLDARMVELGSGEIGWDSFTLEYKISPPCDVVITQWASIQYLKVFNLLWRIKRVEFALATVWRRCTTGARGVLSSVEDKVGSDWKRARCVIAEMVHFVNQLQYYILFEVIEASWDQLQTAMKPDSTLDDLIEAHKKYITSITHKGLLGSGHRDESFLSQLHYILKTMLGYKEVVDELYAHSVAEFLQRQQLAAKVESRTAQGKWGIEESSPAPLLKLDEHDQGQLASLRARLIDLSAEFKTRVNTLLYDLAHQPDADMRFLGVVMNFNEVYKPRRRKKRSEHTSVT